jgi:hypothetical protein
VSRNHVIDVIARLRGGAMTRGPRWLTETRTRAGLGKT